MSASSTSKIPSSRANASAAQVRLNRGALSPLARFAIRHRTWILAFGHAFLFTAAYWLAFALRFDFEMLDYNVVKFWKSLPWVLGVKLSVFYLLKHYHGWWRYVTFADLLSLARASLFSLFTIVLVNHYVLDNLIPRAVVIIDTFTAAVMIGGLRSSWRLYREGFWFTLNKRNQRIALMVGVDHTSGVVALQIHAHPELALRVVGFLDRSGSRRGAHIGGIPIVGSLDDVAQAAHSFKATDILVVADKLTGAKLRNLMDQCEANDLNLKIIPSLVDHLNGNDHIPIRDVDINDLLRRDPVRLDMATISALVAGRTVLVTGAGGSIGSEICRQLLPFEPGKLVLVDQAENALFLIHNELLTFSDAPYMANCVANVVDSRRMEEIFREHQPDLVLHAAAHKHVGLMEENVVECVRNNVFGTKCLADLADKYGATEFVLISTDKAVHPASVMGASKHIAERYIHAMAQESQTRFVVVRFGNVLGSNGSVVPIFQEQIRRGGPITVTDKRMMRFFMTIPEASQLVLQAAAMGKGGEIFVLEMGEQIRIVDLARDLIRLSGLAHETIEIVYIGARPGEKLYEELYFDEEESLETSHPKVRAAYHRPYTVSEVVASIDALSRSLSQGGLAVREQLKLIVPEYVFDAPPNNGDSATAGASL